MTKRPQNFNDYVGQERMKRQLAISMSACKKMNEPLPHLLVSGPPGLGKTTIAQIIASEMNVKLHEVMASNIKTLDDLESIFINLDENNYDVLFIDEIHRLPMAVEEMLYPIMEDFTIEVESKDQLNRKVMQRFWIPRFTLIGATTLAGDLSQPIRDRFGLHFTLDKYSENEVAKIIEKLAIRQGTEITDDALKDIARRCKGTARIAINYFNRCREYATFLGKKLIDTKATNEQFELLGVDELGLDEQDFKILEYLATQTTPIGIDTITTATNVDKNTIQSIIEPYLVQQRLMDRTRSGRRITPRGLDWIYSRGDYEIAFEQGEQEVATTIINQNGMARFGSRR